MKNFWNACKELQEKKIIKLIQSSLPELFVKNTVSEFLFQSICTFVKKGLRYRWILQILQTTAPEYRNNMPRTFQTKCKKNNESNDILATYLLILMTST